MCAVASYLARTRPTPQMGWCVNTFPFVFKDFISGGYNHQGVGWGIYTPRSALELPGSVGSIPRPVTQRFQIPQYGLYLQGLKLIHLHYNTRSLRLLRAVTKRANCSLYLYSFSTCGLDSTYFVVCRLRGQPCVVHPPHMLSG